MATLTEYDLGMITTVFWQGMPPPTVTVKVAKFREQQSPEGRFKQSAILPDPNVPSTTSLGVRFGCDNRYRSCVRRCFDETFLPARGCS
jgi:hypothetical protein